jgi:hypothetical protein
MNDQEILQTYLECSNKLNHYYGLDRHHYESLINCMDLDMNISLSQLHEMHSYLENMNRLNVYFGEDAMDFENLFDRMALDIRFGQLSLFL